MMYDVGPATITIFILGVISLLALIMMMFFFGKLIKVQFQRWTLARKGYVELEHVSETNLRSYAIVRPKGNKFDINDGFYHYIPEAITRGGDILKKYPKDFLNKLPSMKPEEIELLPDGEQKDFAKRMRAEYEQFKSIADMIHKLNFRTEAVSWKFGMPIITYYGDNPDPILFRDRQKTYGSGVIKDMYLRLLLTQRYKDFKFMLTVFLIAIVIVAIANFGFWQLFKSFQADLSSCQSMLNVSQMQYIDLVNRTMPHVVQNSTMIV